MVFPEASSVAISDFSPLNVTPFLTSYELPDVSEAYPLATSVAGAVLKLPPLTKPLALYAAHAEFFLELHFPPVNIPPDISRF